MTPAEVTLAGAAGGIGAVLFVALAYGIYSLCRLVARVATMSRRVPEPPPAAPYLDPQMHRVENGPRYPSRHRSIANASRNGWPR